MGEQTREPLAILGGSSADGDCSCGCCGSVDEPAARDDDAVGSEDA